MTAKQAATLLLFSNGIWINLREYAHSKNNRYSAENDTSLHMRHYMMPELDCGVL